MPIDSASLRDTLRLWGSGVAVVTTAHDDENGHQIAGMTVSAFNSLSLDPPLILVCVNKNTTTSHLIEKSDVFGISMLSEHDNELSERFAGRLKLATNEDRFDGVTTFTAVTGSPILRDVMAWLDCRVHERHDGSTHWILIGEVLATGYDAAEPSPLIYYNRRYHTLVPEKKTVP